MTTITSLNSNVSAKDINLNNSRNVNKEWTFQNIHHLLKTAKELLPKNDILKYTTSVNLLDGDRLKFGLFTANDCRDKLLEVTEMLRRHRTLSELLIDAEKLFNVPSVNDTTSTTVVSAANLQLTENIENPTATSNKMELSLTVRDTRGELTEDDDDLEVLFEKLPVPVQNICTQTNVNSVGHDIIGKGQFNVELERVLTQTNWSRVVVNCGEKVDAHMEKIQETTTSKKVSLGSSALNNKNQMSDASNQKSVMKVVDSMKNSLMKRLEKISSKKKLPNRDAAITDVKRPVLPFIQFYLEVKDKLKEKHPEVRVAELGSLAGKEYRKLPLAQREIYRMKYYKEKKAYLQAMQKAQVTGKKNLEITNCTSKNKIKTNSTDKNKKQAVQEKVKSGNNSKAIAANKKKGRKLPQNERIHWGILFYAKENLDNLINTKAEEKMTAVFNTWKSLDDDDKEDYIQKALRLTYADREKMEQTVKNKAKWDTLTM